MANYGQHADCYPEGHSRGRPCGPGCPYATKPGKSKSPKLTTISGKHKGPYKAGK